MNSGRYNRGRTGAFEFPYVVVFVISALSFIAYVLTFVFSIENQGVRSWLSRIAVGLGGSYLTFILVDRTFRNEEEKDRKRIQQTALEQLRLPLQSHLNLLGNWYIASSLEVPEDQPNHFDELFDEYFIERVKWLDFSKESPVYSVDESANYVSYSGKSMKNFKEEIDQIISQYGAYMTPDLVQNLQSLSRSNLMGLFITLSESKENIDKFIEDENLTTWSNMLAIESLVRPEGTTNAINNHLNILISVIEYYEDDSAPNLDSVEELTIWKENHHPMIGSARVDLPIMERRVDRISSDIKECLDIE